MKKFLASFVLIFSLVALAASAFAFSPSSQLAGIFPDSEVYGGIPIATQIGGTLSAGSGVTCPKCGYTFDEGTPDAVISLHLHFCKGKK